MPNTTEGIKQANEKRNASKKRSIRLSKAKKKAAVEEANEIRERQAQTLAEFWVREEERQRRRKDSKARKAATSAWASRAA